MSGEVGMESLFLYRAPAPSASNGGPLKDRNIAIQPSLSVAGWPTDAGSAALKNYTSIEDATVIERLRRAGAFVSGSTRMSEFGFGLQGGNAGSAIDHQVAEVELVLDMTGECRHAASAAGVFGFKPSYGLLSRAGVIGLIPSMETCGILAGNVNLIRRVLEAVSGQDQRDLSMPDEAPPDFSPFPLDPSAVTIGVIKEMRTGLTESRENSFLQAIDVVRDGGFAVKELSLPGYELFQLVHNIIGAVEASSNAGRYDSVRYGRRVPGAKNWNEMYLLSRGEAFGPLLKSYLLQGAFFQFERYEAYENACRIRARLVEGMKRLFAQCDVLLFPEISDAEEKEEPRLPADVYTRMVTTLFANVTGQPALCLRRSPDMALSGYQLAGARLDDARVLTLGEYLSGMNRGGKK
jgi:aspartyl-tRNA(Asn)/glutamyl-tRNA(Gln) amidotransferase subunit A